MSGDTAGAFAAQLPKPTAPGGVTFQRDGDAYTVTTRGGLVLSGRVGGGRVFSNVALKGRDLGTYTAMLHYQSSGPFWQNIAEVTDVAFEEKHGWGVIRTAGTWSSDDGRLGFRLVQRIAVHPDFPCMLCNVSCIENIGKEPLDIRAVYFRQYAPYASDKAKAKRRRVPNLWKPFHRDAWVRSADGAWWGALTTSSACTGFRYFLSGKGRNQHPDACFEPLGDAPGGSPEGCWRLAPGETYDPDGTIWVLCLAGEGGYDGWEKAPSCLGIDFR